MTHPLRMLIRFVFVMVALLALSVVLTAPTSQQSPYMSGLTDLTAGSAMAAPGCGNKVCPLRGKSCNSVDPSRLKNCVKSGGTCVTVDCT